LAKNISLKESGGKSFSREGQEVKNMRLRIGGDVNSVKMIRAIFNNVEKFVLTLLAERA
jgi:hypothetical protein